MGEVPKINYDEIDAISGELLGTQRVNALAAFCTEAYLQRVLNGFITSPNTVAVDKSSIACGNYIVEQHRTNLERAVDSSVTDAAPRVSGLHNFFRLGFGAVENVMVSSWVSQADGLELLEKYDDWYKNSTQQERVEDMRDFLESQDAELLALNLLDTEQQGSILNYIADFYVEIPRVTGQEPYRLSARVDSGARTQITEGALTALFLLREHYIAQCMADVNAEYETYEPEPEASETETPVVEVVNDPGNTRQTSIDPQDLPAVGEFWD